MTASDTSTWILTFSAGAEPLDHAPEAPIHEVVDGPGTHLYVGDAEPAGPLRELAGAVYRADLISDSGEAGRATSYLVVVGFPVPDDAIERFDDWYETEHAPLLLGAEDWLRVRRYRVREATGPLTCLAVHDLASLDAMASPERQEAARGPKRALMAAEAWYGRSGRWTCRRSPSPLST